MTPLRNYYDTNLVQYVASKIVGKLLILFNIKNLSKKEGKDTQALENEIDALVYRLLRLTDEETAIVEGK